VTVGYHVAVLRALFADAVEEGVVRSNPTSGVRATIRRTDDVGDTPTKALTRAQLRRLLDEFPDDRRLFFEFLAHTGLRVSEAIEVRWHTDLDLGRGPRLRVSRQLRSGRPTRPKSKAGLRTIPLSPGMGRPTADDRGAARDVGLHHSERQAAHPLHLWRDVLHPAAVRAEVPWVGFATFRHTCASLLFAARKNVKQVQVWLGHADPGFTVRDLHPSHGRRPRRRRLPRRAVGARRPTEAWRRRMRAEPRHQTASIAEEIVRRPPSQERVGRGRCSQRVSSSRLS
jgi:integrase